MTTTTTLPLNGADEQRCSSLSVVIRGAIGDGFSERLRS